ncbi:PD-(D/E)XK nuclease-like domain-containing protein [Salmonella enterica subsp. enterica serovar Cerro]|uniref:Exonuclease VIII n=3 Tax=Salmonella enterica TaxID=28901 RepID=A0A5Y3BJE4_SALER|nr:exonuclease VIII [Salmonella enterica subsp. enterica serovar Cerro]EAU5710916.1 exonuclease VIII [Salmonella enterica]EBP6420851.1 exonuclease VIII [Salmonella enterica subsp. enterica]EDS4902705.1 exonuclease VIII [Salmonella enterica subsp. enterica serovar Mbandaka]EAV1958423.1 exonuclease VIII [Salmonella enterica]
MEFFYVVKATQKSGKQDATVWFTAKSEARANLMLDVVLEDAEIETGRGKDYARPIRTNFPVVNELPPEGEISFTFTNYYRLGEDGMTWEQIPGVTLPSSEAAAVARQHIVDGVDTETGEVLEDHTENFGNESNSPAQATAPAPELTVVATMPLRHRVLAQYIGEGEYLYHVDASQKKEILRLEMDTDNSYVQNLLLAAENVEAFKKAIEHDIHKIVNAVKKVFPVDGKTPELATVIQFLKTWFETEHIDRGLLVKEWAKGNRVSAIQRTESGANAGGGNKTDRNPDYEHTLDTLDVEIAMATLPMDFNIYELPGSVYRRAKEIVKKKESPFKEWSAALRATPGILDYSRAAIFALIRSAHPEFYHYPGRLQGYINANLTETDHENPTEEALTAARHTPEKDAVEEANRQLAAARGEYVEGISDPDDPKWVHNNYSASNQGEKEEVVPEEKQPAAEPEAVTRNADGTFDVSALFPPPSNQTEKTEARTERDGETPKESNQQETAGDTGQEITTDGGSGTGGDEAGEAADPVENGNFTVPDDIQPGIYYDIPNEAYHAGPGVSKSQLDDIADTPAIYLWRKNAPVDTEKTKSLDTGTAFHCRVLEPEEFSKRFIIAQEFNRRTSAGKEEEKTFLEECARTGRTVLTAEEGRKIELMYQSVMALPLGQWLVESAGYAESSVYWEDPETGILCRCRPDKIIPEFHWIMDVKTTADIQRFRTAYYDYRYHVQDAFYSDGYRAQFGEIPTFVFLVASTTAECGRYPVEIFMMGEDAKLAGQREYRRNLQTLAECLNNDEWPAIKTLSLPRWAKENANA